MEEIWKDCHLSDKYSISNLGRVKNNDSGKILKLSNGYNGYKVVHLSLYPKRKLCTLHRLLMFTFKSEEHFEGAVINHKDCNKHNNSLDNLEWCTIQENNKHAITNNLHNPTIGIDNNSKLTEEQVLEIRKLYNEHVTQMELSKQFKVCQTTINLIVTNRMWKHLHWEPKPVKEKVIKEKIKSIKTNPMYKLKNDDIPKIKDLFDKLKNYTQVGKEFGISDNAVRKIIKGKTWTHI